MGKAQLSQPVYCQGAAVAPPFSAAKLLSSQLERRADIYLPRFLLTARPAAAWAPSSSFKMMVFKAASPPCLAWPYGAGGGTFPACRREEKQRSDGDAAAEHGRGEERGDENVNFLPKEMRARNIIVWGERAGLHGKEQHFPRLTVFVPWQGIHPCSTSLLCPQAFPTLIYQ